MNEDQSGSPDVLVTPAAGINELMTRGAVAALRAHRQAGDCVVIWRDGRVLEVPPDEIILPGEGEPPISPRAIDPSIQTVHEAIPPSPSSR